MNPTFLDPVILLGMIFTLIVLAMIGGFVLLFPITRRLGAILERRLSERPDAEPSVERLRAMEEAIRTLRGDLEHIAERQDFAEALLEERKSLRLPES